MGRNIYQSDNRATRKAVTQESSPPGPPTPGPDDEVTEAGIVTIFGASTLVIDVDTHNTSSCTLQPLAWNELARLWFATGPAIVIAAAGRTRHTVESWASKFAYVQVTAVSGTVDLYSGAIYQADR